MTQIYTNTWLICTCDSYPVSVSEGKSRAWLFEERHSFQLHSLADLYFCPQCKSHKCNNCTSFTIESKYCPNCMADHSNSDSIYCTKNCFSCPKCSSHLVISSTTTLTKAKIFKFSCTYCEYIYSSSAIDKPKSLLKILESEQSKQQMIDPFNTFLEKYKNINALQNLTTEAQKLRRRRNRLSADLISKLNDLNLSNLSMKYAAPNMSESDSLNSKIEDIKPISMVETDDVKNAEIISNTTKLSTFQSIHQRQSNILFKDLPNPKLLIVKKSFNCGKCKFQLLLPEPSPILLKFPIKWNAMDLIPRIKVSKVDNPTFLRQLTALISIINPHSCSQTVLVSTLSEVPDQFLTGGSFSKISTRFPIMKVNIGAKQESSKKDAILKSIPTAFLTEKTATSRAELLLRTGSKLSRSNPDISLDIDESFDDDNIDSNFEQNENWCLIPLKYSLTGQGTISDLRIPVNFTVETLLQDKPIKYTFWSVLSLGSHTI